MPTIVNSGNFKNGMVPDVIGARDSATDIIDGIIDRTGEIRKRSGKIPIGLVSTHTDTPRSVSYGSQNTPEELVAIGCCMTNQGSFAFTTANNGAGGEANWFVGTSLFDEGEAVQVLTRYQSNDSGGGRSWTVHNGLIVNSGFIYGQIDFPYDNIGGGGNSSNVGYWDGNAANAPVDVGILGFAVESHQGRLWVATGTTVRWTGINFAPPFTFDPAAFLRIPSWAGSITDMHSLGESLIVVSSNAVFVIRGIVATNALDLGVSVDTVVVRSGGPAFGSSDKSRAGIVWGNQEGLWVTNGSSVRNLVDDSNESSWSRLMDDNLVVSSVRNRIIAQSRETGNTFIYYIDAGHFVRQSCPVHSNVVETRARVQDIVPPETTADVAIQYREVSIVDNVDFLWWIDDMPPTPSPGNAVGPYYTYRYDFADWVGDYRFPEYVDGVESPASVQYENDVRSTTSPRLKVLTQPLDPGFPFTDNRMNQILVSGYMRDGVGAAQLGVSLVGGRGSFIDELESVQLLEYGFDTSDIDTTQRIGLEGNRSTPATRVLIEETGSPAQDISIYGIGAEFTEDFTVGNDS